MQVPALIFALEELLDAILDDRSLDRLVNVAKIEEPEVEGKKSTKTMTSTKRTIVDLYFSYWQQHIQPIKEEKLRARFGEILTDVGLKLYGADFALELTFLLLKAQNPDIKEEKVRD